jgi:hypothetical protein
MSALALLSDEDSTSFAANHAWPPSRHVTPQYLICWHLVLTSSLPLIFTFKLSPHFLRSSSSSTPRHFPDEQGRPEFEHKLHNTHPGLTRASHSLKLALFSKSSTLFSPSLYTFYAQDARHTYTRSSLAPKRRHLHTLPASIRPTSPHPTLLFIVRNANSMPHMFSLQLAASKSDSRSTSRAVSATRKEKHTIC